MEENHVDPDLLGSHDRVSGPPGSLEDRDHTVIQRDATCRVVEAKRVMGTLIEGSNENGSTMSSEAAKAMCLAVRDLPEDELCSESEPEDAMYDAEPGPAAWLGEAHVSGLGIEAGSTDI